MLSRFSDVKREIFSVGNNLKINNVLTFNFKGKNDVKLDPAYETTYTSQRYTNISELSTLYIKSNVFLTFNFRGMIDGQFASEEIFISYPHIESLRELLTEAANYLLENEKEIYAANGLTEQGAEVVFESVPFASNKKIAIVPAKVDRSTEDKKVYVNGVAIILNEDQYCEWTDLNTFLVLVNVICNEFQLGRDSATTMIMAMLYEMSNKGSGSYSSSGSSNNTPRSIFGNKSNTSSGSSLGRRAVLRNQNAQSNNEESEEDEKPSSSTPRRAVVNKTATVSELSDILDDDDELPIDETPKTSSKPTVKRAVPTQKKDSDPLISLNDALSMADEDVDLSELDKD